MGELSVLALIILLSFGSVRAGTYYVTFPNFVIPGMHLDLHVAVTRASEPVDIKGLLLRVDDNATLSTVSTTVSPGTSKLTKLWVPEWLKQAHYKIVVTGTGGLSFNKESAVRVEQTSLVTFIQTDKSRYSGGQEVKYRAIFLRPNLLPYEGPVTLIVHDSDNNIIKTEQFDNTVKGVVNSTLLLAREPVFGTWSLTANAPRMGTTYAKQFDVRDYVLPKFKVQIKVRKDVKETDASFQVSVRARFTFKTDVLGNCSLLIYNPDSLTAFLEYSEPLYGAVSFTIQMSDLRQKLNIYSEIKVRATVTDSATFLTMMNEKDLVIIKTRSRIEVTRIDRRDYFFPGTTYQTPIKVTREGKAPGSNGTLTVTPTGFTASIIPCSASRSEYLLVEGTREPNFTVSFDVKGYGEVRYQTQHWHQKIQFEFSMDLSRDSFIIYPFSKNPSQFIAVSADKVYAKVGDRITVQVDSSDNLEGTVTFEVFSRGAFLQTDSLLLNQTSTTFFSLVLTAEMIPLAYVSATYVTPNGLLLKDRIVLLVEGLPFRNNVSVEVNSTLFRPRDGVCFTFRANPGSTVYALVEDQRNRLLGVENDIFAHQILYKLRSSGETNKQRESLESSEDHTNFIILTDYSLTTRTPVCSLLISNPSSLAEWCPIAYHESDQQTRGARHDLAVAGSIPYLKSDYQTAGWIPSARHYLTVAGSIPYLESHYQVADLVIQDFVRSRFPETWLWEEFETGSDGHVTITRTLPDTVTTWVTSIFASDRTTGFSISEDKLKINVRRKFFLTMHAPPSLIVGETFLLQVTVFNNLGKFAPVQIQIDRSDDIGRPVPSATVVQDGQGHSTFVQIQPNRTGILKLTARAKAGTFSETLDVDMVETEVIITPAGIPKTINHPKFVTLSHPTVYRETIVLGNYPNAVSGTRQVYATITGDIMTPTRTGLQNLIRSPSGCGEQNMVNFAPDVFVTKYMSFTGQLTEKMKTKALSYILQGYQTQMTYKRLDGSYSAFFRDPYGGTWLTAYVLKCFHQAKDLITVDTGMLRDATRWLLTRQNSDGSFREQRPVRYIDHVFTKVRMSAFVIISLMEVSKSSAQFPTLKSVIESGKAYMERKLPSINDAYSLSILCYALALSGSSGRQTCFSKLQNRMLSKDDKIYWHGSSTSQTSITAKDIEATAYGLLTYIALGRYAEALPIARWLAEQRNAYGGYHTTQDTVVAIQALTEYSLKKREFGNNTNMSVNVAGEGFTKNYAISSENNDASYRQEMSPQLSYLNITVSGDGMALIDIVETFYVSKSETHPDIGVSVSIVKESVNSLIIRPVLRWNGSSKSNLLMMEIEMPTGFDADLDIVKKQTVIKRQETFGQIFVLYFDSLAPRARIQVDVRLKRVDQVVGNQPCYITVYDYYEPEKQSVTTYESGTLKSADICDVCPLCSWCNGRTQHSDGWKK